MKKLEDVTDLSKDSIIYLICREFWGDLDVNNEKRVEILSKIAAIKDDETALSKEMALTPNANNSPGD